jgi:TP901 family phage tail tape measure protein
MDVGSVVVRILADPSGLTAGLAKASGSMSAFSRRMSVVGAGMTKFLSVPLIAVGAVSIKMASDFQKSMTLIQTQAGGSARDVKVLSASVLELARHAQHGPKQLADGLYHLKSVGMSNVDAMKALTMAEHLASVGGSTLETTTNAVAGAWKTGITGARDFGKEVGTINAIVGAGNLRMEDLNSALGTGILTSARSFGISLTSVGAALALLTSQGQPATQSATRLRMAISLMGAPTAQAAKALQGIGLGATDMAKALRSGGLVEAVGLLKDHMQGLSKIEQSQLVSKAFGGGRMSGTMLALIQGYDDLVAKQNQIVKNSGKFGQAVAEQAKEAAAKWHRFTSVLADDAVKIGNVMLPAATSLADDLGKLADGFAKLSPGAQSFIVKLGIAAAAAGPVVFVLGKLIGVFSLVAGGIGTVISTIGALSAALSVGGVGAFAASFAAMLGPIGLVVAGVVAVGAAIYGLHKAFGKAGASAAEMKRTIGAVEADTSGSLQKWADKALGGHLVVKKGELVWAPKVSVKTPVATSGLTTWVHLQGAQERKAIAEEALKTRQEYIKSAAQLALTKAQSLDFTPSSGAVAQTPAYKARKNEYNAAMAQYKSLMGQLDKLGGKHAEIQARFKPIVIKAKIDDLKDGIKTAQSELTRFTKKKQTANVILKEGKLRDQIAAMRQQMHGLTSKNWKILVEARIEKTQANLSDLKGELTKLNKQKTSPKIEAQKATLEKAIASAQAKLKALNAQKTSPKIGVTDNATAAARNIHSGLVAQFATPITQTITITTITKSKGGGAHGGIFSGPTSGYMTLMHGTEAIVPLASSKRTDAARVLNQIGAGGGSSVRGGDGASYGGYNGPQVVENNIYLDGQQIAYHVLDIADAMDRQAAMGVA